MILDNDHLFNAGLYCWSSELLLRYPSICTRVNPAKNYHHDHDDFGDDGDSAHLMTMMMMTRMMVTLRRPGSIQRTVGVTGEKDETQKTQEARRPPLVEGDTIVQRVIFIGHFTLKNLPFTFFFSFCHILAMIEERKKRKKYEN